MIKFFRKVRQQLLTENKFSKYLLYALGEIVLVVAGILIAIQVSNWNEGKKSDARMETLLDAVENDLIQNINLSNRVYGDLSRSDSIAFLILNNKITRDNYRENEALRIHVMAFTEFLPLDDNLNKLIQKEESVPVKYEEILDGAKIINQRKRDEAQMNLFYQEAYKENIDYFSMNFSWARQRDSLSIEERIDYFLNIENYKNRVYNYCVKTNNLNRRVVEHRALSMALLGKMKILRNGYTAKELGLLYDGLGMKPFDQMSCESRYSEINKRKQIRQSSMVANLQKIPVHLAIRDRMGVLIRNISVEPGQFTTILNGWNGPEADHFRIFEEIADGKCRQRYLQEING
ncbi:MAG: DUF6090 family protein, partial [Flavobacteriaceae bacterium]